MRHIIAGRQAGQSGHRRGAAARREVAHHYCVVKCITFARGSAHGGRRHQAHAVGARSCAASKSAREVDAVVTGTPGSKAPLLAGERPGGDSTGSPALGNI